jgi:NitT/TauT family transport system permease protein
VRKLISPSLVEMVRSFGARQWMSLHRIYIRAAFPATLPGVRLGFFRAFKGVTIDLFLVSVFGFDHLFDLYLA